MADYMAAYRIDRWRSWLRRVLGAIYLAAGIAHLTTPQPFVKITPDWVPMPEAVVIGTGIAEIVGAIALLFVPQLYYAAGIAFAAYAVCVYPANIKHAIDGISMSGTGLDWTDIGLAYHIPRLAFQPVLVWWALFAGNVIDWPFSRRRF
ncbi:DoxX family protein [Sphingomonas crocodyli]|uniref:DoxX family protein n=1 Tax=Sphingomonas crocodyli TaxID=1979270 RepID=A0A437M735_9SPHN|nr:DoxX family protein [Sphingomonas crocodyli]RVT93314.1 hypothetical protein EOD43_05360 [Sphingomonas crocodyli]